MRLRRDVAPVLPFSGHLDRLPYGHPKCPNACLRQWRGLLLLYSRKCFCAIVWRLQHVFLPVPAVAAHNQRRL